MREENREKLLRKKAFILFLIYIFFSMSTRINASVENNRNFSYEININNSRNNDSPYATYKNYNIYIGSEKYLKPYITDSNNICIIDGRNSSNPNMRIYDSYRITSTEDMFNILAILLDYEKQFPSEWSRSLEGLQIEWVAHNISYNLGIFQKNSGTVDLDNRDAFLYEDEIIKFLFKK